MFTSKGLFKAIPCPKQDDCNLPACWFLHEDASTPNNSSAQEYDPFSAGVTESPPVKRRKLQHHEDLSYERLSDTPQANAASNGAVGAKPYPPTNVTHLGERDGGKNHQNLEHGPQKPSGLLPSSITRSVTPPLVQSSMKPGPERQTTSTQHAGKQMTSQENKQELATSSPASSSSKTMQRPVSPPTVNMKPKSDAQTTTSANPKTQPAIKKEPLNPRALGPGPAQHKSRINFLRALHQQIIAKNREVVEAGPKYKSRRLAEQEMITLALDEEEELARKYGTGIYQNMVRQRAHTLKNMKIEQWAGFVPEKVPRLQRLRQKSTPQESQKSEERPTGITVAEELAVLRHLQQPLDSLQQYGYVAKQPTDAEAASAKDAVDASGNWESCDRCGTRFQVYPGRDEQGRLASGGSCRYHWAKAGHRPQTRADRGAGASEDKHGCCNQPFGSDGCTEAETHVFNVKDRKRLASYWQWKDTPEREGTRPPLTFDCEMCYTTRGMEVVRVTAVSWPENKPALDVLVRPYGEILDLNTRFSGVSKKVFAEALRYESNRETVTQSLQKVASPADARQLLFDLLTPTTPLIGHAIENDLNTLRIIHPFVIDTVLLYPHRQGLPRRNGLRNLALQNLGRTIQSGSGHDSKEDAVATGELVTLAVKNKWKVLQASGWKLENGKLVQGEGSSKL